MSSCLIISLSEKSFFAIDDALRSEKMEPGLTTWTPPRSICRKTPIKYAANTFFNDSLLKSKLTKMKYMKTMGVISRMAEAESREQIAPNVEVRKAEEKKIPGEVLTNLIAAKRR